jgi:DNA-binding transcriptional ArsR family regulator
MRTNPAAQSAIAVLANPTAYRILAALAMHGRQTTSQIAHRLVDVPVSSLYRQLARLRGACLLRVTSERKARGAVERTYGLASPEAAAFKAEELARLPIGHVRATLQNFLAGMVAAVTAYISSRAFARNRSSFGAALVICSLTDEDYRTAIHEIGTVISRAKGRSENAEHTERRSFYIVSLPEASPR